MFINLSCESIQVSFKVNVKHTIAALIINQTSIKVHETHFIAVVASAY